MPKIPVDECPAGPEMDAAVAEAMGWKAVWVRAYNPSHFISGHFKTEEECKIACTKDQQPVLFWSRSNQIFGKTEWNWCPSIDIAAAWELAPSVLNGKHLVFMYTHWTIWHFDEDEYGNMPDDAIGETAPLAICRAFLKAKGMEEIEVPE